MKETITNIQSQLEPFESVVLEAAHIYADQEPRLEQKIGTMLAGELEACLTLQISKALLIDDYNVSEKTLKVDTYLNWLTNLGFVPDEVVMEGDLVPTAHQLIEEIRERVPRRKLMASKNESGQETRGLGLWTPVGKVPLLTSLGRPSCALLDVSFYIKKSQKAQACLTVLPQEYCAQQAATLAILKRANKDIPIVNLFFNPDNNNDYVVSCNI